MDLMIGLAAYWSNDEDISVADRILEIKKMGYDNVEIYCGLPFFSGWNQENWIDEIHKIKRVLSEENMEAVVHAPHYDMNLAAWNPKIRKISVEQAIKGADVASMVDADILVVHPGYMPSTKFSKEGSIKNSLESMKKISEYAKSKDIKIGIENLSAGPKALCVWPKELINFVEAVNKDNIGITLDVAHANSIDGMTPIEYLEVVEKHFMHIHLSDNRGGDSHFPIGVGNIDFRRLIKKIREKDYQGFMTLEGWLPSTDSRDFFIQGGARIIENMIKEINA